MCWVQQTRKAAVLLITVDSCFSAFQPLCAKVVFVDLGNELASIARTSLHESMEANFAFHKSKMLFGIVGILLMGEPMGPPILLDCNIFGDPPAATEAYRGTRTLYV
ncbi:hypothetical protein D9Y22_25715 [Methylorubrum sp. DB1722]|nr:hypothetical protein [Methylorubrum sp. DB1722]